MWLTVGLSLKTALVLLLPVASFVVFAGFTCLMRWHRF
ncbi:hypothetical protein STH12_02973 [Shewanella khirikhana]|uniref:Uncharacterized protein n=1 Tax=Shewanella khirikhana TaxID=1965282 RepID=A0ABM7DQR7_9GAMM|nr:hypothetical protein STH12_02973 [Shewanella khirikhana]